jgi:hypothetical protein
MPMISRCYQRRHGWPFSPADAISITPLFHLRRAAAAAEILLFASCRHCCDISALLPFAMLSLPLHADICFRRRHVYARCCLLADGFMFDALRAMRRSSRRNARAPLRTALPTAQRPPLTRCLPFSSR